MRQIGCEFEADVLSAVLQSRWPDRVDADLREHVRTCAICSDVAAVAGAIECAREETAAYAAIPDTLPDSGRVWWKAQMRARREAVEAAGRPITAIQVAAFACALVLMGWSFFYELFLEGGAGRLEVLHPGQGLHRFSTMMILNTALCATFAVQASRLFRRSWHAMAGGMILTAAGILLACWGMASQVWVFGGMLLITLGELMLSAVAQYTLMRLTPADRNAGFYYSMGVTLQQSGRIAGASLAFPILIHASSLKPFAEIIVIVLALEMLVLWSLRRDVERLA